MLLRGGGMGGGAGELSHWCDGLDSSKTRCGLGIAQCADEVVLAVLFEHLGVVELVELLASVLPRHAQIWIGEVIPHLWTTILVMFQ